MCGIVGYIGQRQAPSILLDGLKRLEYRGYDSAGLATISDLQLKYTKSPGKLAGLEKLIENDKPDGCIGIAHTRWATHGEPSETNAHPHLDCIKYCGGA